MCLLNRSVNYFMTLSAVIDDLGNSSKDILYMVYMFILCKKCLVKINSEIMNRKTEGCISKYDM